MTGSSSTDVSIQGNYVGLRADGLGGVGNGSGGILVERCVNCFLMFFVQLRIAPPAPSCLLHFLPHPRHSLLLHHLSAELSLTTSSTSPRSHSPQANSHLNQGRSH
ncbi:MAG UNVERIFIED_CONTAM: hypothetical protein LVR29_15320 [Microcystis novacekii LVE1205-3]